MNSVDQVRQWLAAAQNVAALTGAGMSAESGVPTFRGSEDSLWRRYRPEELANPHAFARNPRLVWEWYDWRRGLIRAGGPNPAHFVLAELAQRATTFTLVTQNVDGLDEEAGCPGILRLHGDIWKLRCLQCGSEWIDRRVPLPELPPSCACGGMARPGVVWFGESLPGAVWAAAEQAVEDCQILLVIGTSAVVYPAAGLIPLAKEKGARVVEINPEPTSFSGLADECLRGRASQILPELVN